MSINPTLMYIKLTAAISILCTSANLAHGQFVENIKIIHEIHAEAPGDQFGWIARNISDVDGDGINDFVVSAPFKNIDGPNAGRIYMPTQGKPESCFGNNQLNQTAISELILTPQAM